MHRIHGIAGPALLMAAWLQLSGCAGQAATPQAGMETEAETEAQTQTQSQVAASPDAGDDDEKQWDDGPLPPGAPQPCITIVGQRLKSMVPVGDHSILFYMRGGEVWRSRLRSRCSGMRSDSLFSYEMRSGRLCAGDLVTLLDTVMGRPEPRARCSLGEFEYMTEDQAEAFKMIR